MTISTRDSRVADSDFKAAIAGVDIPSKTNGTPLSALLSAGIGVFMLGLLTTLAETITSVGNSLKLVGSAGPLSGKTTYAVVAWLAAWVVSYLVMRGKDYAQRPIYIATFVLIAAGFLLTFPLFFDLL